MNENALIVDEAIEVIIKTDLKTEVLQEIDWNYQDLENLVKGYISKYENLVVTEEEIETAKKVRAKLNKAEKDINDNKIKVNKILNVASLKFTDDVKKLTGLISDVSSKIDKQVKEFEELEKQAKKTAIEEYFNLAIGDLKSLFPFSKFWEDSYYLKGSKIVDITDSLSIRIKQVEQDLKVISESDLKFVKEATSEYVNTLSLSKALEKNKMLIENEKKLEEYQENERLRKIAEIKRCEEANLKPTIEPAKTFAEAVELETKLIVTVATDKLDELKDYLYLGGYNYEVLR